MLTALYMIGIYANMFILSTQWACNGEATPINNPCIQMHDDACSVSGHDQGDHKNKKTHWFISFGGDSDAHWEGSILLGLGSVPRRTIYISPEVRINIELGGVPSSNFLHSY